MNTIMVFLMALALSTTMIPLLMRRAANWQLLDIPDDRKQHVGAVPRVGGIAIALATLASAVSWSLPDGALGGTPPLGILLGSIVIVYFGLLDDRKDLDYRLKFGGQILGALLAFNLGIELEHFPLLAGYILPVAMSLPLTLLLLLGSTNAFNLLDGLDGLAAGCASLSLAAIMALSLISGNDTSVVLVAAAALGGILGFLRHNTHPAIIYMGDAGSQFLGFTIGGLAIALVESSNGTLSPALILSLLGLPVIDTAMVMMLRIRDHRSPFSPDRNHIHHKLLSIGLQHHQAVGVIYVVQAAIVFSAVMLRHQGDLVIIGAYCLICCLFLASYLVLRQRHQSQLASISSAAATPPGIQVTAGPRRDRVRLWLVKYVEYSVALYLIVGAVVVDTVTTDFSAIALGLAFITIALGLRGRLPSAVVRLGVYLAVIYISYLSGSQTEPAWLNAVPFYLWLASVGVAVSLVIALTPQRHFRLSTQDLLVALLILGLVALPLATLDQSIVSAIVIRAVIFIYACELLIMLTRPKTRLVGLIAVLSLLALGLVHVTPTGWETVRYFWNDSA